MTAIQISLDTSEHGPTYWLRQIALQLAIMNERNAKQDGELAEIAQKERESQGVRSFSARPYETSYCGHCGKHRNSHQIDGVCPK